MLVPYYWVFSVVGPAWLMYALLSVHTLYEGLQSSEELDYADHTGDFMLPDIFQQLDKHSSG